MTLTQECRGIEARHPSWHIFISDAGKPWAVMVHPADQSGCGVTLDAPGMARIEQVIAAYDYAVARHWNPWQHVAYAQHEVRAVA